jgi:hypothetical protein
MYAQGEQGQDAASRAAKGDDVQDRLRRSKIITSYRRDTMCLFAFI